MDSITALTGGNFTGLTYESGQVRNLMQVRRINEKASTMCSVTTCGIAMEALFRCLSSLRRS